MCKGWLRVTLFSMIFLPWCNRVVKLIYSMLLLLLFFFAVPPPPPQAVLYFSRPVSVFQNKTNHFRSEVGAAEVQQCPSVHGSPLLCFCLCQKIHFEMKKQTNKRGHFCLKRYQRYPFSSWDVWAGARAAVMLSSPVVHADLPWSGGAAALTAGRESCLPPGSFGKISFHGADAPFFIDLFLYLWGITLLLKKCTGQRWSSVVAQSNTSAFKGFYSQNSQQLGIIAKYYLKQDAVFVLVCMVMICILKQVVAPMWPRATPGPPSLWMDPRFRGLCGGRWGSAPCSCCWLLPCGATGSLLKAGQGTPFDECILLFSLSFCLNWFLLPAPFPYLHFRIPWICLDPHLLTYPVYTPSFTPLPIPLPTPSSSNLPNVGFFICPLLLSSHRCQSGSVTLFGFIVSNNPLLGRKSKLKSPPSLRHSQESPSPQPAPRNASLTCRRAWGPASGVTRRDSSVLPATCCSIYGAELIAQKLRNLFCACCPAARDRVVLLKLNGHANVRVHPGGWRRARRGLIAGSRLGEVWWPSHCGWPARSAYCSALVGGSGLSALLEDEGSRSLSAVTSCSR